MMNRSLGLRPTHVWLIKRTILLAVVALAGYTGYRVLLARRPALPERGAEWVAYDYLTALQRADCDTAYSLVAPSGQAATSPKEMSETCRGVYASIDNWQFGQAQYAPTHLTASVPVVLYYHAAWATDEPQQVRGNINFKLEQGNWRLVVALPFVTAIAKLRQDQHMGG